ncbi:MAG: glycerol kinase GlpK [Actinomycetota bacterium]
MILAIDAGTTGITVLVVDHAGSIIHKSYNEFPQYFPRPGWVEHDPREIWDTTLLTAQQAIAAIGGPGQLVAIGITNQRETTVVWDRKTLEPVHNAIVWQCRRSAPICDELRAQGLEPEIRQRTGLVLDAYFSATKLTWLMRNVPDIKARALSGSLAFGTVDSWLIAKLTEGEVHATDMSNASRTMLYNIHDLSWDPFLLDTFEVPISLMPEVSPSGHSFGTTRVFGEQIPITGVAGDQQAALFGQACFKPGMSKNTYGTGSFVLTNMGSDKPISEHNLLTSIACGAWGLERQVTYACEGAIFVTGAAIQWLRDGLGLITSASEAGPLAESVSSTDGVYFVPALTGLGAPHWNPNARGTITGISRGTTKAHLVRATVEAMAYQTKDVVDAMHADTGVELLELRVDGGASVMNVMCQFQADMLQLTVARPVIHETTGMGAAYLAGITHGFWDGMEDVETRWKVDRRFEPKMSIDERDSLYAGWKRALPAT